MYMCQQHFILAGENVNFETKSSTFYIIVLSIYGFILLIRNQLVVRLCGLAGRMELNVVGIVDF